MGLFDWLTGKKDKVEIAKYRIWLTHDAKIAGIQKEVAQAVGNPAAPGAVIVVAHFNDCLEQLQAAVAGFDKDRVFVTSADLLVGEHRPTLPPTNLAAFSSLWANGIPSRPMMMLSWSSPAASLIAVSSSTTSRWKTLY